MERDKIIARLEELGDSQVRILFANGGLPPLWQPTIVNWLVEKDNEERRRNEAVQTEHIKAARSAKRAAWSAAIAAMLSAAVAIASLIVAWFALYWPDFSIRTVLGH